MSCICLTNQSTDPWFICPATWWSLSPAGTTGYQRPDHKRGRGWASQRAAETDVPTESLSWALTHLMHKHPALRCLTIATPRVTGNGNQSPAQIFSLTNSPRRFEWIRRIRNLRVFSLATPPSAFAFGRIIRVPSFFLKD